MNQEKTVRNQILEKQVEKNQERIHKFRQNYEFSEKMTDLEIFDFIQKEGDNFPNLMKKHIQKYHKYNKILDNYGKLNKDSFENRKDIFK